MLTANMLRYGLHIPHLIVHLRVAEGPCRELISQIFMAIMTWFHLPTEEQNSLWARIWPGENPLLVYTAEHLEHPTTSPRTQNFSENTSKHSHIVANIIKLNKHVGGQISPSFINLLS